MLFPYSSWNSIPQTHLIVTFANQAEPVRWGKDGISISGCQQNVFYSISSQIQTVFEPIQGPRMMNVQNEPVHVMACVVNRETPPGRRWKLCEFQHRNNTSVSGMNLIVWWRGLVRAQWSCYKETQPLFAAPHELQVMVLSSFFPPFLHN